MPKSNEVRYKKINIDEKYTQGSFLALEDNGSHRNFFVNLLSHLMPSNYFVVENSIETYNFEYTKLKNISKKIDYLQKKYPDLNIHYFNKSTTELAFDYNFKNKFEKTEVPLNELIYNSAEEIDKKFFDKSLTNQLLLKSKEYD